MHFHFLHVLEGWQPFAYVTVFFGLIFEGDTFLYSTAFLTRLGFFKLRFILPVVIVSISVGDLAWFWLGHRYGHTDTWLSRWFFRIMSPFEGYFRTHPLHVILLSKFSYGLHHLLLTQAGTLKMPLRKFILYDYLGNLIWLIIVGGIGYASGASLILQRYYHTLRFVPVLAIVLFLLIERIVIRPRLERKVRRTT